VDTQAISVVNAHTQIGGNEIWADSFPAPEACVNLPKLIRGRDEENGLVGGTGRVEDFSYLWQKYNAQSGVWETASPGDLSNDQHNYLTDVLSTTGSMHTYRRTVESGECTDLSELVALHVKPRPAGRITDSEITSACISPGGTYDIIVPIEFTGGIGPYVLSYDDGNGQKGVYSALDTNGTFRIPRVTENATQYLVTLDTIMDGNGCWVTGINGVKEAWLYRDSMPALLQDTFRVCGERASIRITPGLGNTVSGWGPENPDYDFTIPGNSATEFVLLNWPDDLAFHTVQWTQQNGVCPLYTLPVVVELYRKPIPASVTPTDTVVYFRQFMPMWADSVPYGQGTWDWIPGNDWMAEGGTPVTDVHNPRAVVDLGGTQNMRESVTRELTWTVGNKECPDTTIHVTIERHDLVTYSAFSPNGDAFNEFLILDGLEYADRFTMQIFSRHGVLVKTVTQDDLLPDQYTGERNIVWDGRMENGSEAEDGTYFYMIEVIHAGQTYKYKNYLELVRGNPNQ
jgi:gliding motility-associated-like protein